MILRDALALTLALSTLPACGGKCPDPQVPGPDISLDLISIRSACSAPPGSKLTINATYTLIVSAEQRRSRRFPRVMRDPSRRFGLIGSTASARTPQGFTMVSVFMAGTRSRMLSSINSKKWRDCFAISPRPPFCEILYNSKKATTLRHDRAARLNRRPERSSCWRIST